MAPVGSRGLTAGATRRDGFRAAATRTPHGHVYKVDLRPSGTSGSTVEKAIGATFVGEPRSYPWTNTISF